MGGRQTLGQLKKARDAPQVWADMAKEQMSWLRFSAGELHPSVYSHVVRHRSVVVHVDECLRSGPPVELLWLSDSLRKEYNFKQHSKEPGSGGKGAIPQSGAHMGCSGGGIRSLSRRFPGHMGGKVAMREGTPMTKDGPDKSTGGELVDPDRANKARGGIVIVNCVSGPAGIGSRRSGIVPADGEPHRWCCALSQASHQALGIATGWGADVYPPGPVDEPLRIWTDSGWAGEQVLQRRSHPRQRGDQPRRKPS